MSRNLTDKFMTNNLFFQNFENKKFQASSLKNGYTIYIIKKQYLKNAINKNVINENVRGKY